MQLLKEYFEIRLPQEDNLIKEAIQNEKEFILTGIIQKADTVNANGRIYPRDILEREIENYKKIVQEKRAWGECVEEGSKILTLDGWKDFRDISETEQIYTLNVENKQMEIQAITRKIARKNTDGYVYHFKNRNLDIRVTSKHKFVLVNKYGKTIFTTAEEIYNNRKKYSKCYIPKTAGWQTPEGSQEYFTLSGVDKDSWTKMRHDLRERYSHDLRIDLKTWAGFMGLYLAEGDCSNGRTSNRIHITQNEGENANKIRELLSGFPSEINWSENKTEQDNGKTKISFAVNDARLHKYLHKLGNCYDKYIPQELKMLSPEYLEEMLEWFILGDGRTRSCHDGNYTARELFSVSRKLVEDLHEVLLKSGGSGNIQIREPYDRYIGERLIEEENQQPLHILHLSTTRGIYLDHRFTEIEKEEYSDNVYCVTVNNGTFYCMSPNGKSFWSHNCDHPDSSVVELKNVCLRILDIFWKGDDVIGKIKIIPTRVGRDIMEIFSDAKTIGISSRALGETKKNREGWDVVTDSLQIVAWDLVCDASTPGAYLRESINLTESQVKEISSKVYNKSDRIYRICNRILNRCDTHSCEF